MAGHSRWGASGIALALVAAALVLGGSAQSAPAPERGTNPLYDIKVKFAKNPVVAGGSLKVKVKVRNLGSKPLEPQQLLVQLVGDKPLLARVGTRTIPANAARSVVVDVTIPAGAKTGKRTLRACGAKNAKDQCGSIRDDAPLTVLAPARLTVSPRSSSFGTTSAGTSSTPRTFTVRNAGGVATGVLDVQVVGTGSAEFATWVDLCSGASLAAGATCAVSLAFTPTSKGAKSASLTVTGTPGGSATASLSGTGANPAALTISPPQHAFGTRTTGTVGGAQAFTVTNTGEVPSGTLSAALTNGDQDQFQTSGDTCGGVTLAVGASCSVTVQFAPTTTGSKVASLQVSATPGGSVHVLLSGTGAVPAVLTISPEQHSYGLVATGTSVAQSFVVTNNGGVAGGIMTTTLSGAHADQFIVGDNTCGGLTLAPGASCSVSVSFAPTATGAKLATIQVSATPGGNASASLSGDGQTPPPLTINPASWNFGAQAVNTLVQKDFAVTNTSPGSVGPLGAILTGPYANQFVVLSTGCNTGSQILATGAMCVLSVRFSPTKTGAMSTPLTVTAAAGNTGLSLSGTGANPAELYVQRPPDFGNVQVGSSAFRVLTLTNIGGALSGSVTVSQSNNDGEFVLSENTCSGQQLAGGASCSVKLTYTPTAPGSDATNVFFAANPGGNQGAFVLGGTGTS